MMVTAMAYTTRYVTLSDEALQSSMDTSAYYPPSKSSPLRRPASGLTATRCVFDLVEKTTPALIVKREPIVNGSVVRHREALRRAKVLSASDPTTLEIASGSYYEDYEAENRVVSLETREAMVDLERRLASSSGGHSCLSGSMKEVRVTFRQDISDSGQNLDRTKAFPTWSPDAATLSAAAAAKAAKPGRMGAGPRVTLVEAYSTFRVLNLAEKDITMIDPAFTHFENLTDLDLGRNYLYVLEHLPTGLVFLSCAANKLYGRALDPVAALPSLKSLDLSYNSLEVESMLSAPKSSQKLTALEQAADEQKGRLRASTCGGAGRPSSETFLCRRFPALQYLDLSWNLLCNLDVIIMSLRPIMETLRHLFLAGNPVSLLPLYRERTLISSGSGLLVLDYLSVTQEELSSAKKECEFFENWLWDFSSASKNLDCVVGTRGSSSRPTSTGGSLQHCLDVMHVGVKLLHIFNLPEIETLENETREASDRDESGADDGVQGSHEHSTKTLGEVEFVIPGHEGNRAAATVEAFEWKPGVSLPDTPQNPLQAAGEGKEREIGTATSAAKTTHDPRDNTASIVAAEARREEDSYNWETTSVTVTGEGSSEGQPDDSSPVKPTTSSAASTGDDFPFVIPSFPADETVRGTTLSPHDQHPRVETTSRQQRRRSRDEQDCDAVEKLGGGVRSSCDQALGSDAGQEESCRRTVHPRRRRRLVGRGKISLSPFLDPEWMLEQQQREERRMLHLRGTGKGDTEVVSSAGAELKEARARPGSNHSHPATLRGDGARSAGEDGDYVSTLACRDVARSHYGAVIGGNCDIVLEEWVAQGVGGSGNNGNEDGDKGSNDDNGGGREAATVTMDDAAQPLPPVSIQIEVSLNPLEAILAFAEAGSSSEVPREGKMNENIRSLPVAPRSHDDSILLHC